MLFLYVYSMSLTLMCCVIAKRNPVFRGEWKASSSGRDQGHSARAPEARWPPVQISSSTFSRVIEHVRGERVFLFMWEVASLTR